MIYFCPKCHRPIIPPKFLSQVKSTGVVNLQCANFKQCGGKVKIKPKQELEVKENGEG